MSDVIGFLEQMGSDSKSRFATGSRLEEALKHAGIEPDVRSAMLAGDQPRLESLMGARRNICNLINFPGEEE